MQIKMKCKRALAFVLALLMLMTMLPTAAYAEELPSDVATSTDVAADPIASQENEPVSEEPTDPDKEAEQPAAEDSTAADDPAVSEEDAPAIESEDIDSSEIPDDTPEESTDSDAAEETTDAAATEQPAVLTLQETIDANGFAYVRAVRTTKVYNTPDRSEAGHIYTLTDTDDVLLATEHNGSSIKVWYYVGADAAMRGYVDVDDLSDTCLSEDEVSGLTNGIESREYSTDAGYMTLYLADGEFNPIEEPTTEDTPAEEPDPDPDIDTMTEEETGNESEADDPAVDSAGENENAADNAPQEPTDDVGSDEETAADPEAAEGEQLPEDELLTGEAEILPDNETDSDDADLVEDETLPDSSEEVLPPALIGDYLQVTTDTRVFSEIDDTATDDYFGDLYLGVFAHDAIVRVEEVHQDSAGRSWYLVTFLYGDDFADGRMKWIATDMIWILADEAEATDQTDLTVTDYAYPLGTPIMRLMSRSTTAMNGFSLKSISGSIGSFSVGDTAYGSSGRDRDYSQIATLEGHGKIYATPHYLEGYTVYCLEHTLPGPGENISGGGKQPTGPYIIVDWDGYMSTAGYSGAIYGEDTMHAIAWVLGHTYPFMVLDRSDSDNNTWSRVAGQFAIREVIKQMEGAQYVRDYWDMDNFYAASNNAPGVYLEYARWLAENAIAHARRTGKITVSNKSAGYANGSYYGTATYTTDADFMRISKNVGTLTGHTGGEDDLYYYLNSGDTVTVYSSSNSFAYGVESMMDDEAGFYVGVPSVEIQKVLIPIESVPYPTDEAFVDFAVTFGAAVITKTDAGTGAALAGATFEVVNASGTVVATAKTGADGTAVFENLQAGTYTIRETSAPTGYTLSVPNTQSLTVAAGQTANATFANEKIRGKIAIYKVDADSKEPLAGAAFSVTDANGNIVATLVTDANGTAETDWLPYGTYDVTETAAPDHYINSGASVTVSITEHGKTYTVEAENEPMKGGLIVRKKDAVTGAVIEDVQFDIYQGDVLVATMTTDANGVATCNGLDAGTYTVKEHALPNGYVGELVVLEGTVTSDVTTVLDATNMPSQSKIKIIKTDSVTGEMLPGAEFSIANAAGIVIGQLVTGEDGTTTSGWLPYGVYTITETQAPDSYINRGFSTRIEAYENGKTYPINVENEPTKGYLQITKADALDGTLIKGVQFDIYQSDKLISTMITGADGVATSEALPKGTYTVKEHGLPEGYTGELATMEVGVKSDETTQLTASNQPIMGQIRIEKSDALTGEMLAGAEFTITRNTGLPSHKGSNDGEVVAVMTTDADGVAVSPLLTWGTYTVAETKIPEHYENQPFEAVVTISEHEQTYTVEAENKPTMGYIRVVKTNSLDQTPIAGVIFDITQNSQVIGSIVTDENGVAVSEPLPKGIYTVSERDMPIGYVYEIVNLKAEVRSDETTELVVTNKPIEGKFRIEKRDSLTGDRLAGAIFTITRISGLPSHNGSGNGEVVATITTDSNGVAETPWLTYGVYRVEETGVPAHYVDNDFSVEAVINEEDMGTYLVDCENEPTKGWIQLVKVDALDRTPIAGVVFDIYRDGELVSSMTTNEDGVALSEPLHKGEYMVYERDNPTGYTGELNTLEAVVKSDETTHLSCTNQPIQGRIQIMKRDQLTKEALAGAEFTVTRVSGLPSHNGSNDGEVVAVITTDANGMAITPLLTWGTYRVEETGVPEHYVDNSFSVEVTITEDQKIYTVDVENEPTKGWIRLTKTDRLNGNPIEGVQFDIFYNDQYGEGLAGTMVTDANGIAMSEPLRKGQYIVREHGETAGYVFEEIELAATVKSDEITDVAATNMPVLVQLTIYKRDLDEYDGDDPNTNPRNKAIPTMPNDYHIPDPATRGDGVLTGTVFQVSAGADILDRQGNVIYPEGMVILESLTTTGDDASVTTEPLWPGLYAVQEIQAPTGYQIDPNPFYVDSRGASYQSTVPTVEYTGLSRNEILYGAQAIVKVLGNNDNTTDSTRVEIPEADAEFRVFLKSAGSYENARDFERDYLITDEHGYAMTKPLPYGVYVLEQTAGKDGYEIKGPIEFSIDGTESLVNPPPLTLSDKPILYRLKLIKTDADTGKILTLANTSFKIKDSQGKYITQTVYYPREMEIDTFTTDATGSVTLPEVINWGHYFIEEIVAPEGYLIRTDELAVFIGNAGDQPGQTYEVEIEIPNKAVMGRIELVKTGLTLTRFMTANEHGYEVTRPVYEDRYLAGATFEIRAAEDIIGGDGTLWYTKDALVETITTSGTGSDMSKELPLGRYYLIETGAPVGYILEDVPYEADLTYLDGNTPVVTIQVKAGNKYLPASVALVKHKEVTEVVTSENGMVHQVITTALGDGFTFGLYNAKDIHYVNGTLMADTLMAVGVTDEQGLLHISGYFPHGEYYIKELAAPAGWQINPDAFPVSILPDMVAEDAAVIQVVYPAVVYDELIYTPITLTKTDITGVETLPGALIEVRDSEGTLIYREFTDANGEIPDIPVVPGTYTFREVYAPEGYELNTTEMTFNVDELGNITGDTVIRDDYTRVTLVKQDMDGNPLAGVEFALLKDDEFLVAVAKSDAKGIVTFEKIPCGKYTIREVQPLPGYLLNDTVVHLTVDNAFVNPSEPLAVIENHPIEVILHKIDKDNKPLPGAIFGLFDSDGFLCMTALSDVTGTVKFSYVPYGSYTIRELEAPDGYLLSHDVIPVEIDATYQNSVEPLATVVNQAARLRYKKVDTSGKLLPGVEFSLINAGTGEVVEIVTSDDAGEFVFTRFTFGDWIVRETKAPEGYNIMPDIKLKVDENWVEPEPFTLVNIPNHYEFVKTDNKGNPMPGVKFKLEDGAGNILRDLVSGEDGIVHVTDLTPGVYIIREIETAEGYTLSEETIKVVIDEKYIVPDEMFRFVNYPNIQTDAGFEMTSLMWSGVALVSVSCAAVMVYVLLNKRRPRT